MSNSLAASTKNAQLPSADPKQLPENAVTAQTPAAWRAWLEAHHQRPKGVWLVLWKKSSGRAHLNYDQAVEEALCFGRIDSKPQTLDAVENLEIPADLATALNQFANATAHFERFPRSVKRSILEWIGNAKAPPTRTQRIEETARLAEINERANQWRKPAP